MIPTNYIHKHIVDLIKGGKVRQRPKWYYVLTMLACIFGLLSLFLMLLYLVSFLSLVLREHLFFEAFAFGPKTVFDILHMVPPLLVVLVVTVFFLLHLLVRHFAFAYMRPVIATLGVGLSITMLMFSSVLYFDKDSRIARFGEHRHGIAMLHMQFRDHKSLRALHGVIVEKEGDVYSIQEAKETTTLIMDVFTRKDRKVYEVGDSIFVLGINNGSTVRALAVHIDDGTFVPPPIPH